MVDKPLICKERSHIMKRSLMSLLLFVVVLAIPVIGFSQEFRDLELNPFFGYAVHTKSAYDTGFPQSAVPIPGQFRYKDAVRGGLRFNVNTTGHWGEELFFSYEPGQARIINGAAPALKLDTRILNFGLNAMYYLSENQNLRTRIFATLGLGGTMDRPTGEAIQIANDPLQGKLAGFTSSKYLAFNYGVGFKHRISRNFGFRMDLRGFVTRNPTFGLPRSSPIATAVVFPANGAGQTAEVSAGLIFRLKK